MVRRILVTATNPKGNDFARSLNPKLKSIYVVACPALHVYAVASPLPKGNFDAMVVTSRHAVIGELPELPVIAVGAETACLLRDKGFDVIQTGQGGIADLNLSGYKNILYPCALDPTYVPHNATPWGVYETHVNPDFIIDDDIQGICTFSVKAAKIIKPLLKPHQIIFALSPAIAEIFKDVDIHNLVTCAHPRYDDMKKLIEDYL